MPTSKMLVVPNSNSSMANSGSSWFLPVDKVVVVGKVLISVVVSMVVVPVVALVESKVVLLVEVSNTSIAKSGSS